MNKYEREITSFRQAFMTLWRLAGNLRWYKSTHPHTRAYRHTHWHTRMCAPESVYHRYSLSVSCKHPQPLSNTHCLGVKTHYRPWAGLRVLVSTIRVLGWVPCIMCPQAGHVLGVRWPRGRIWSVRSLILSLWLSLCCWRQMFGVSIKGWESQVRRTD